MKKRRATKAREWWAEVYASPVFCNSIPHSPFGAHAESGVLYADSVRIPSTKRGRAALGIMLVRVREVLERPKNPGRPSKRKAGKGGKE